MIVRPARWVDVIDYHAYSEDAPIAELIAIHQLTGLPVMVSEFGFRASDSGLLNTRGAGPVYDTQVSPHAKDTRAVASFIRQRSKFGLAATSKLGLAATSKLGLAATSKLGLAATSKFGLAATSKLGLAATSKLGLAATSKFGLAATSKLGLAATSKFGLAATSKLCLDT